MQNEIVIVAAKRTPIGGFLGKLSHLSAVELGVIANLACLEQANIDYQQVNELIMGCVLTAGLGQAPARQTALNAGLGHQVITSTINKVCGSGMQAVINGAESILLGRSNIVVAGGMESMSNAPYLLPKARSGYRLGHGECLDHMWYDGLQDAYERQLMGCFGELAASTLGIDRATQDDFATLSMQKALYAQKKGAFLRELAIATGKNEVVIIDENPQEQKLAKIGRLTAVFQENGTLTAGNSSSIADGAASLILMTARQAQALNLVPLVKIKGWSSHAQDPKWFTTAPAHSIKKLLSQLNWQINDVDLWEINEAFAVVTLAAINELKLDINKVNINGGACALGHPIGASGARIIVSLIYALLQEQKQRGIASICIGGGEALAIALER